MDLTPRSQTAQPIPRAYGPRVSFAFLQPWSGTTEPTPRGSIPYLKQLILVDPKLFSLAIFLPHPRAEFSLTIFLSHPRPEFSFPALPSDFGRSALP